MMHIVLTDEDKQALKSNFEQWEKDNDINGRIFYNGNCYAIFDDGSVICLECLKSEIKDYDDYDLERLDVLDFFLEGSLMFCEVCQKPIDPNHYLCSYCGEPLDKDNKSQCCINEMEYIESFGYEF